jgi:phosphoribosylformimino-5-aminoimidazole carboxamide ribonucleotide (ProFAR) isomerase
LLRRVVEASGLPVLAAGGIRSGEDLAAVERAGCEGAVVGRALLDGSMVPEWPSLSRAGSHSHRPLSQGL